MTRRGNRQAPRQTARAQRLRAALARHRNPPGNRVTHSPTNHARLFDLGQNATYMPRLRVSGPAGSSVRLTPAEVVNADGRSIEARWAERRAAARGGNTPSGRMPVETWFPQFFYVGCRYLQADFTPAGPGGQLPRIEALEGQIVHSIATPVGDFDCSNPLLNRIRDLVRWAQRANMVSVLTDCPHREKLGWLEQYHLNGPSMRYEFDLARIFTKGMNDMADSQLDNGLVPNIAPEYTLFDGTFRAAAEWGSAFIIVPWQQYLFDGDTDLAAAALRCHEALRRLSGIPRHQRHRLPRPWRLVRPRPEEPGLCPAHAAALTATAFYYHDAWILAQAAALLGKAEDATALRCPGGAIRASFNREFFHADTRQLRHGLAMRQCHSAGDGTRRARSSRRGAGRVGARCRITRQRDDRRGCGLPLPAAGAGPGRSLRVIFDMNNQSEKPGYGYQLKMGRPA